MFVCRDFQLHRLQARCAEWIQMHGVTVVIKNNSAHCTFISRSQGLAAIVPQIAGRNPDFCGHGTATDTTRLKTIAFEGRTALFWVITQRVEIIYYRRFGTTYRSLLLSGQE